jgi:hypothetical protein
MKLNIYKELSIRQYYLEEIKDRKENEAKRS